MTFFSFIVGRAEGVCAGLRPEQSLRDGWRWKVAGPGGFADLTSKYRFILLSASVCYSPLLLSVASGRGTAASLRRKSEGMWRSFSEDTFRAGASSLAVELP